MKLEVQLPHLANTLSIRQEENTYEINATRFIRNTLFCNDITGTICFNAAHSS